MQEVPYLCHIYADGKINKEETKCQSMMCKTNLGLLTWYVFYLSKKHTIVVIMYLLRVCKAPTLQ